MTAAGASAAPSLPDRRGQVFENPVTGERAVVLSDPRVQAQGVLVSHLFVKPGGRVSVKHRHPNLTERFRVLHGEVGFLVGDEERVLGPGELAEVPPETLHDWWQVGAEEAQVLVEVEPGERFVEMVGAFFGLARDGKVDKKGVPHPLQLAVSATHYSDVIVVATPPPWVQKLLFGVLAPIGRRRGLRPTYDRYLSSDVVVEPDPGVLALLTPEGRLAPPDRPSARP
ncbi:MAG: cupin domain-containing protein [Solirubrobacterales bacterium]